MLVDTFWLLRADTQQVPTQLTPAVPVLRPIKFLSGGFCSLRKWKQSWGAKYQEGVFSLFEGASFKRQDSSSVRKGGSARARASRRLGGVLQEQGERKGLCCRH